MSANNATAAPHFLISLARPFAQENSLLVQILAPHSALLIGAGDLTNSPFRS